MSAAQASHVGASKSACSFLHAQQVAAWCLLSLGNLSLLVGFLLSFNYPTASWSAVHNQTAVALLQDLGASYKDTSADRGKPSRGKGSVIPSQPVISLSFRERK